MTDSTLGGIAVLLAGAGVFTLLQYPTQERIQNVYLSGNDR
jgi:hypothetical protein